MSIKFISIIIPAYKAEVYIKEALESIAKQTYKQWEVIVVEDASKDQTESIVKDFSASVPQNQVKFIRHEVNKGLGATRNTAIRQAEGEYIAFLDHDDAWQSNHLELLLYFLEQKKADVIYSASALFRVNIEDVYGYIKPSKDELDNFPISLCKRNFVVPSATLVSKSSLIDVGLMSEDRTIHGCEDMECWLKLALSGYNFAYTKQATCYYRKHPEAMTAQLNGVNRQKLRVLSQYAYSKSILSIEARLSAARLSAKLGQNYLQSRQNRFQGLLLILQSCQYDLSTGISPVAVLVKKLLKRLLLKARVIK